MLGFTFYAGGYVVLCLQNKRIPFLQNKIYLNLVTERGKVFCKQSCKVYHYIFVTIFVAIDYSFYLFCTIFCNSYQFNMKENMNFI